MSGDTLEVDLARIKENCELLVVGWQEKVEYKVPVAYHRSECVHRARTVQGTCPCPVTEEARSRNVRRPGLMEQLEKFREYRDTDREPQAERQAPRVKKVKYMPELGGFWALDEIACDVSGVVDKAWIEAGRDRTWASMGAVNILGTLPAKVASELSGHPDCVWVIARASDKWVMIASRALRLIVSDSVFGDTVCGNCGGGLVVPSDNDGDVRCVGKPGRAECGETYPMSEWINLYERQQR